jgi:hypothetical protein
MVNLWFICGLSVVNLSGWWLSYPSEKYEFVSRDYHSQYMEKQKMFQTTNQLYIFGQSQL